MNQNSDSKKPVPNEIAIERLRALQTQILHDENNPPQYDKSTTAQQLADRICDLAKTCRDENGVLLREQWFTKNAELWREARVLGLYQDVWNVLESNHKNKK